MLGLMQEVCDVFSRKGPLDTHTKEPYNCKGYSNMCKSANMKTETKIKQESVSSR